MTSKTGKLVATNEEKAEVLNFFCLSLHWQPFFPQLSSEWTTGWGVEEEGASRCKRSGSWAPEKHE